MAENFEVNLLRMIASSLYFQNCVAASREMYGRSYFALGAAEKLALEQVVVGQISSNYQAITPELLAAQQAKQPMGFPIHTPEPTPGSSTP